MAQQTDHIGDINKIVTAVEWLYDKLKLFKLQNGVWNYSFEDSTYILHLIEQAKQIEKEQIQKAFSDGQQTPINHPTLPHYSREEYYNETYSGQI